MKTHAARSGVGFAVALPLLALLRAGCASRPANPPLAQYDHEYGYRMKNWQVDRGDPEFGFVVAMSGGGTRAAAFSYGTAPHARAQAHRHGTPARRSHPRHRCLGRQLHRVGLCVVRRAAV